MKRRAFVGSIPFLCATPELFAQAIANIHQIPGFFTQQQLAALRRLSDMIMPSAGGAPSAPDAGVPEFLDFLVGQSPTPVKNLYRTGLDSLNTSKFKRAFADLQAEQCDELLAPLRDAWTYEEPADPLAKFLRHAKADILTATMNSREWAAYSGRSGNGSFWLPPQ
ncbi:MAG TPA: gluconate 2-dehydrogenase subunit 3 family protein [Bryobacteraceae bacterium]|nr:gluconate 2-dehydrogenase subunit 3 family protein [Bryobacteraceae bacterium]